MWKHNPLFDVQFTVWSPFNLWLEISRVYCLAQIYGVCLVFKKIKSWGWREDDETKLVGLVWCGYMLQNHWRRFPARQKWFQVNRSIERRKRESWECSIEWGSIFPFSLFLASLMGLVQSLLAIPTHPNILIHPNSEQKAIIMNLGHAYMGPASWYSLILPSWFLHPWKSFSFFITYLF